MTSLAIEGACAFAWRNYLLRHSTGEYDFALLQIAAVAYLKNLDKLHDDRAARAAADQALDQCLKSGSAQADARP
jgi:hypothetical protein